MENEIILKISLFLIILILVLIVPLIWSTRRMFKKQRQDESLFKDRLWPLAVNAATLAECTEAWDTLVENCLTKDNFIKVTVAYRADYYAVKFYLKGKLDILKKLNNETISNK